MADLTIPGVGKSKYQTEKLIEDLVKVEGKKLETLNQRRDEYVSYQEEWQRVNRLTQQLETIAYKLYSVDSPFREKQVRSDHPELVSAEAQRGVPVGRHKLVIESLASSQQLQSAPLPATTTIPAGSYPFTVGPDGFSVDFSGGSPAQLVAAINASAKGLLQASLVEQGNGQQRLLLGSLHTGAAQQIAFPQASQELATQLGWIGSRQSLQVFLPGESAGATLQVQPGAQLNLSLPSPYSLHPGVSFSYSIASPASTTPSQQNLPATDGLELRRSHRGPPPPVSYQDVTLFNLGDEEALKRIQLPSLISAAVESAAAPGQIWLQDAAGKKYPLTSIDSQPGEHQVELGGSALPLPEQPIVALIIDNPGANPLNLGGMGFSYRADDKGNAVLYPLQAAANAQLKYNEVAVERPSNNITDLIPGLALSLKEAKPGTVIELEVLPNYQAISEQVILLIQSYNDLLTELNIVASREGEVIEEKINLSDSEYQQAQKRLGLLQGNIEINRIRSQLRRVSSQSYPTPQGQMALSKIGVSTNAAGVATEVLKSKLRGYLEIDTEKFQKSLEGDWQLVRDIFGYDSNSDLVIDQGLAFQLRQLSYEHVRAGGPIRLKLQNLENDLKGNEKEISDYRDYLEQYRVKLKRKYALMEGSLRQLEDMQRNLDSFGRQGGE